jgi:hypothetical protein
MVGWPSAAQDRLPADVPRARHGRPGVPRRLLAVGRGGWGGFIPLVGPGQGLWHVGGVEVDAGLAGGSRGAMREQPGDDLDRHAAADQPGRLSIPGSVACVITASRADRAEADQGLDRRNAAVSVPVAWRPSPVRAGASCTGPWTTRPWPDAGQRWRAPGLGPPTSASLVHAHMVGAWWAAARACRRTCAGGQRAQPDVLVGRRPHAAGPGCGTAGRPVLRPQAVGPRLGGADRPGRGAGEAHWRVSGSASDPAGRGLPGQGARADGLLDSGSSGPVGPWYRLAGTAIR